MRLPALLTILLTCLALSGCGAGIDRESAQTVPPSIETTSSITRSDGPAPAVDIGMTAARPSASQPGASLSDSSLSNASLSGGSPPAVITATPVVAPQAYLSSSEMAGVPLPSQRPAMLVIPDEVDTGTRPSARMHIFGRRFRDAKPINFGRSSPRALAVHGVDVSRWQGEIDWDKLRTQGANFVYIKATDGGDHLDPMFRKNWRAAQKAGLKHGAYHFFYWCRTAGEQADWFIRNVPRERGALPPVIDVEWNGESSCRRHPSRDQVLEKMQVFLDRLERYYGQRPIIYTSPDFYRDNLRGELLDYPFWLRSVAAHPSKVYPGRKWIFWQYSSSGISHGVDGRIDLNVFHGSEDDWHQWVASRSD
jgi:lysozyme